MKYRLPENKDREIIDSYVKEHHDNNEVGITSSFDLTSTDYYKWIENMHNNATIGDKEWGKAILLLCFEDNDELVGLLSIRYELSESLVNKYGHIGYGVRPSKRRQGYASKMLKHALSVCKEKGLERVVVGCYKDNLASKSTILKNGGVLFAENDNFIKGKISQYFYIEV